MDNQTNQTPNQLPPMTPQPPLVMPPVQPEKKSSNMVLPLIIFGLISLISTVYFLIPKQQTPVAENVIPPSTVITPTVIPTALPTPTGPPVPNDWKTYDGADYTYKYPPTWTSGEDGKALYNLQSPDFNKNPFKGSIIIIEIRPMTLKTKPTTLANKFDAEKTLYQWVLIDDQPGIQYNSVITAGTEGETPEMEYRTVTIYDKGLTNITITYQYEKDHKSDSLNVYLGVLTSFFLKSK